LQGAPHTISGGAIQQLRFSPDGEVLAITSSDPDDGQQRAIVELVDPRTHRLRLRLAGATRGGDRGADLPAFPDRAPFVMANVVFLGSTGDLVVALIHGDAPNGPASVLYRVDGGTGAIERELRVGRRGAVGPSVTADGRRLLLTSAGDHKTWEIDTGTLRVRRTFPVGDLTGVVSPDGRVFVMGSGSGRVRSLDLRSGRVRAFRDRHDGAVVRAAFAPGGDALLTSDADGQVIEWDVGSGTVAQRFTGHSGEVGGLDVSADGRTLVTAATDGRAIVWDIAGDRRLDRRFSVGAPFEMPSPDTPRGSALSPDGRTLAVTHSTGTVDLVDTGTLRRRATVQAIRGHATVVAFSPDGRLLAIGGESGRIVLLDTRTLRGAGELTGLGHDVESLAFSPDGRLLAASEVHVRPTPVRMWDVRRRTRTRFRPVTTASSLAFSPDGRLIAMAAGGAGTEMLEARSGRLVKALQTADSSRSVAFSPDGDLLVVGLYNGMVAVYSTRDWKQISRPIEAHTERVTHAGFTPDGRVLATAGADGSAALWDVATQKPIGAPVAVAPGSFTSAAFTPDGSHLFAVSTRGDAVRLDATPEAWKRHACLVAGRDLTPDEWHDVLPERPYRTVCSRG
jgi:WD40 repeat protein